MIRIKKFFRARCRTLLGILLSCVLAYAQLGASQSFGQAFKEYDLKAVFLFNFAQFVDWPPEAFNHPTAPFVIGILGDDPFGNALDETIRGESVNGHPFVVQRYRTVKEITGCHILFISRSETDRLKPILEELQGKDILTVSDIDEAARRGTMIRFVTDKSRVRLKINVDAAKAAGLTISSKLLRPAEIVTSDQG